VSQQFLDGAQIAAGIEEVRGEAVAQRVRGRRLRQAEPGPEHGELTLHKAGIEWASPGADEQRAVGRELVRARGEIDPRSPGSARGTNRCPCRISHARCRASSAWRR
jgi:hypothetical protein